jgi:hypothetical protein
VAQRTEARVFPSHLFGVEIVPVRIDTSARRRVALHAVRLLVTRRAALHAAARRFTMLQQP